MADASEAAAPPLPVRARSRWARLKGHEGARRAVMLLGLALFWELYARYVDNALVLPTFSATLVALFRSAVHGPLLDRTWTSLQVLALGYGAGVAIAAALTAFVASSRIGTDVLTTLTAILNPLPAVALLPLALLWFGLGLPSIVFVIVHSVLWPVALNAHAGFRAVPMAQRMAGQNYGLEDVRFVRHILIPAAFPAILSGLKIGWAFAWRTLIAAELVFGVASRSGGIGWFIFENKNQLETANVFAGLLTVVLIGLFMEHVVFRTIEARTVRRWGLVQ